MKKYCFGILFILSLFVTSCDEKFPYEDVLDLSGNLSGGSSNDSSSLNGYRYVDLGLPSGTLWATCNVGAKNPEDDGDYYAWGEISTKDSYISGNSLTDGKNIAGISGNFSYDVARYNWGGEWRIPTNTECQELLDNCAWEWTTLNGVDGYKVVSKNGNYIFLPAAGYISGSRSSNKGANGCYWSATYYYNSYNGNGYAYYLSFGIGSHYMSNDYRYEGKTVRPVCSAYKVTVSSNGGGSVEISGSSEMSKGFVAGTTAKVIAKADDGYKFVGWFIDGSETAVSTEETYEFAVNEAISLIAKFEESATGGSGTVNAHEYVDLGLPSGLKWATCNVGATAPEENGEYYAWGEIETKSSYTAENCVTYGWNPSNVGGNVKYDAARAKWGGDWRLPTKDEFEELKDNCTWLWATINGKQGYKVISKKNGKNIFLPAAGYRTGATLYDNGSKGYYWSSSFNDSYDSSAYHLDTRATHYDCYSLIYRYYGQSVRPVTE